MITQAEPLQLTVGGAVNARTGVYIVRPCDDELLRLLERGEYCNVLSSRQVGKTSLIKRTRWRLWQKGYHTAEVEVAGYLGSPTDASEWYQGLLDGIADQLKLDVDVEAWWQASRSITANQKLIQFFREEVIAKLAPLAGDKPVIIFLDEIDSTLALKYTDDFFVAIRAMYNDRASDPLYQKIAFCLVGVATPNEIIKEKRTTPYNIGKTIELPDFDPDRDDLTPLYRATRPADVVQGEAIVRAVMRETGGHPYLTARLLDLPAVCQSATPDTVAAFVREQFASLDEVKSDTHFDTMLRFLNERVDDKRSTLEVYREVLRGKLVSDQTTPAHLNLKLIGLIKRDRRGNLVVRNPVYARLFNETWVESAIPPVEQRVRIERRRAQVAWRVAIVAVALLLLGWFAVWYLERPKRLIFETAKQGRIVTRDGEGAYDIYKKNEFKAGDLVSYHSELVLILENQGEEVLKQIASDGYNPPASELNEVANLYDWLNQLKPEMIYQARKHYFQGRVAYEDKNWSGAENEFQQARRLDPSWALAVNTLARVYMRRRDYHSALSCYEEARRLDPKWIAPSINKCVLLIESIKDYVSGEQACRDVLQLDGGRAAAFFYVGRALEGQGNMCGAYEQYRLAIEKAANTTTPGFNVERLITTIYKLAQQCAGR